MKKPIKSPPRLARTFFRRVLNPIVSALVRARFPVRPNVLIRVPGRKTGVVHATPVALIEKSGRRWVIGAFGETNWVRNLRVAGQATIVVGRNTEQVRAAELGTTEATAFFRDVLRPYIYRFRLVAWSIRANTGLWLGASDAIDRPEELAQRMPVFELERPA